MILRLPVSIVLGKPKGKNKSGRETTSGGCYLRRYMVLPGRIICTTDKPDGANLSDSPSVPEH